MARTYSFSPSTKDFGSNVLNADVTGTVIWSPAEIDAAGVVAFHLIIRNQGTEAAGIDIISRIRVKANGQTVMDCSSEQLRAFQERFSPKGNSDLGTSTILTIPLNSLDAKTDDDGDRCQFMPGASATVEITSATVTTGTDVTEYGQFLLGWTKTTVAPEFYHTLLAQPANVGASSTNGRSPLGGPGFVQGLGITTANLGRMRAVLSGLEVANLPGLTYNGQTWGDMIRASQNLYENPDDASDVSAFQFIKLNQGLEANPATSWLELTTAAGWSASNEIAVYTLVPVQPQRA